MLLQQPRRFSLFDIQIDNDSMQGAIEKVVQPFKSKQPKTVCFVNVNTLNLALEHSDLTDAVNDADYVFADGSGVRIAARRQGIRIRENVNGTDMLPLLCRRASMENQSLYLLGSEPGIALKASVRLQRQFPDLRIAGAMHGYFDRHRSKDVIEKINASGADILLVALGSPIQEMWLKNHRMDLNVKTAIAVGGLLDFYSGRIPRAPLWLRKLGFEWVWRLMQEPRKKFHRYVVGNPKFLWRCWSQLRKAY